MREGLATETIALQTPQLDSVTVAQSVDDLVKYGADDLLYVSLIKVRVLRGNALYKVRFQHGPSISGAAVVVVTSEGLV